MMSLLGAFRLGIAGKICVCSKRSLWHKTLLGMSRPEDVPSSSSPSARQNAAFIALVPALSRYSFLPVSSQHHQIDFLLVWCAELLFLVISLSLYDTASAEEGGAVIINEKDDQFSIPAFVIGVRESIEGCVIVAVLLNALHKSGQHEMKKWVWFGVIIGCTSFIIAGAVCLAIFYAIGEAMPQQGKAAFEGVLALVACAILTQISFKFLRLKDLIMKWESKLVQDKDNVAAEANTKQAGVWGPFLSCISDFRDALNIRHQSIDKNAQGELSWKVIVTITVSALFREGLETVIFLLPISSTTSEVGLVTGCVAGIVVGIAFGIFVLVVGKYFLLDPTIFFNATTVFIFFIAAGLATYSVIELEQIGASPLKAMNHPVLYRPVYNIGCLPKSAGRLWRDVVDTKCFLTEATGERDARTSRADRC